MSVLSGAQQPQPEKYRYHDQGREPEPPSAFTSNVTPPDQPSLFDVLPTTTNRPGLSLTERLAAAQAIIHGGSLAEKTGGIDHEQAHQVHRDSRHEWGPDENGRGHVYHNPKFSAPTGGHSRDVVGPPPLTRPADAFETNFITPAPPGYYNQHGRAAQSALSGMQMTPDEHVKALARSIPGSRARLAKVAEKHYIEVEHQSTTKPWDAFDPGLPCSSPDCDAPPNTGPHRHVSDSWSALHWNDQHADHSDETGTGSNPGETAMISSAHPGTASKMLATAHRLAQEYPEQFSTPRHSEHRTPEGVKWSRGQMAKRGEQVW